MDKRVFVKADARARFGSVVDVVDNVRAAGVDQLGLLTEQRKTTASSGPAECDRRQPADNSLGIKENLYGNGNRIGGGQSADINVTPLIDVLLVLIIIFMVITPVDAQGPGRAGAATATAECAQEQHA